MTPTFSSIKDKLKNLFFEQDGKKEVLNKGLIKKVTISFSILGIVALLFGESQPLIQSRQSKSDFTANPNMRGTSLQIPNHNVQIVESPKTVRPPRTPQKFLGPALIARPGAQDILPGTIVTALLQTAATDGPVKAVLSESVIIDGEERLPVGAILIGIGQSQESRVSVQFGKAIVAGVGAVEINAVALDQGDQLVGLQASRMNEEVIHLGASIGLNFVGGMAEGFKEKSGQAGAAIETPNARNALLNGASKAALEQSRAMMEQTKNKKYSLKVDSGTPVLIFFNGNR